MGRVLETSMINNFSEINDRPRNVPETAGAVEGVRALKKQGIFSTKLL